MKTTFTLSLILLLSIAAFPQRSVTGQVVEIVDGSTFVLSAGNLSFNVRLQHVDPPELGQPLHETVKAHFAALLKGKTVSFQMRSMIQGVHVGKVTLGDVDVSMQMLRDGAAWYSIPLAASQPSAERTEYLEIERMAKAEKRGVWGVKDIRPAYELRLEREKAEQLRHEAEQKAVAEKMSRNVVALLQPKLGITFIEFQMLCGSHPDDRINVSESSYGRTRRVSLEKTAEREGKLCFGFFTFDRDGRLDYISRDQQ